jgi:hypothetical protein
VEPFRGQQSSVRSNRRNAPERDRNSDSDFSLNVEKILNGLENRTTVMVSSWVCATFVHFVIHRSEIFQTSTVNKCYWKR